MRLALAMLALVAPLVSAIDYESWFDQWKSEFGVVYHSLDEEILRLSVFSENARRVATHNAKKLGWTMALNRFADMNGDEFADAFIGGFKPSTRNEPATPELARNLRVSLPSSVDWTTKGAVTPVKNQGQCGSCWAFSTTGSTEGAWFLAGNTLTSLSEQQLVDCSGSYGNMGCNGGLMDNAFRYIKATGYICTEASYPYQGVDGTCKASSCTHGASIKSFTDVSHDSDSAMATAVAGQPVSIAIEADQSSFQFYSGGVLTGACGTSLDHGVLNVGYGTMSGTDYWKVKNSWGASWGMNGYVLLERKGGSLNGGAGQCGLLSEPSYPTC